MAATAASAHEISQADLAARRAKNTTGRDVHGPERVPRSAPVVPPVEEPPARVPPVSVAMLAARMLRHVPLLLIAIAAAAAAPAQTPDYWHEGKAEVCRYELEFRRYGELRQGHMVLIFVTEDFLQQAQVKDERGAGAPSVNVLKVNRIERFTTGIYDYSIMSSTFTPMRGEGDALPATLKTTTSIQDWCGHVWLQTNLRGGEVEVTGHSYFEAEGDERFSLPQALLEDGILAQVRLAPRRLPVGDVDVIPSAMRARLDHRRLAVQHAKASLVDMPRQPPRDIAEQEYRLAIDQGRDGVRTLAVRFLKGFPFHVSQIEETMEIAGETQLLSRAVLAKTMRVAYWELNGTEDAPSRGELGLGAMK